VTVGLTECCVGGPSGFFSFGPHYLMAYGYVDIVGDSLGWWWCYCLWGVGECRGVGGGCATGGSGVGGGCFFLAFLFSVSFAHCYFAIGEVLCLNCVAVIVPKI